MSLVKEEIVYDKECCRTLALVKQNLGERFINFKMSNSDLERICNYPNRTPNILKHIRECCRHEDFFQELARLRGVSLDALLLEWGNNDEFVIYLGYVLTKEFKETELYDKFFNCMSIFKDNMVPEFCPTDKELVIGECVDLGVACDLFTCLSEIPVIYRLLSKLKPRLQFLLSDLEGVSATGYKLPETLERLCAKFGKVEEPLLSRMKLEGYKTFVEINIGSSYKLVELGGSGVLSCYRMYPIFKHICQFDNTPKKTVLPTHMLFHLLDKDFPFGKEVQDLARRQILEDYLPEKEIIHLLEVACHCEFPIYINGKETRICHQTRNKSARK